MPKTATKQTRDHLFATARHLTRGTGKTYTNQQKDKPAVLISKQIHHINLGEKNTGKTVLAKKFIQEYAEFKKKQKLPCRILIIENYGEYKDVAQPVVVEKINSFKDGVRFLKKTSGYEEYYNDVILALYNFTNGLLIIENIGLFTSKSFQSEFENMIKNSEHSKVSTYMIGQRIHHIPQFMYESGKATSVTLNRTNESVHKYFNEELVLLALRSRAIKVVDDMSDLHDKYKRMSTVQKYANDLDRYQSICINLVHEKIHGISESVFCRAVMARSNTSSCTVADLLIKAKRIQYLSKYY